MKNITKRKIKITPLEKAGKQIVKRAQKDLFFAKAMVGVSLLASLVGTSVYLWKKRKARKTLDVAKIRMAIVSDMKEAGHDLSKKIKRWKE